MEQNTDKNKLKRGTRYTGFYFLIAICMTVFAFIIVWNAGTGMFMERDYWDTVRSRLVKDSVLIPANRGNIYSSDGKLLSTTLPEYRILMDFRVVDKNDTAAQRKAQAWRDSAFVRDLDSIAEGLSKIFTEYSADHFRKHLLEGKSKGSRCWKVYPKRVSYVQFKACKELPLFRETPYKGGFYAEVRPQRRKPYGSLASRVIGEMFAEKDSARLGLELSYDSILRGTPGYKHVSKVRNRRVSFVDKEPVDGHDIVTTIDVGIQNAAEKALVPMLQELRADMGVAIVMEVKTGDIKAMVNMSRCNDGEYKEIKNIAILDRMEPGSTFKTASILVALNDGVITLQDVVNCAPGIKTMYGLKMKDHNWNRGGYGTLDVPGILMFSSNIGVSTLIDRHYASCPEKYVDGLHSMGVGEPLNLPFAGQVEPEVRRPLPNRSNWSKSALPWMSIGYETRITPLHTLCFYNAIANDGCFVKPRFVKAEMVNGEVVREFPIEVLREKIASDQALADIRYCLRKVVADGLGKKAGNKHFAVSGKTGTAQVAYATGGYRNSLGQARYLISFCGFFPSEAPQYSCIVAIRKDGLPASGGGHCGPVFREISQAVMTRGQFRDISDVNDSTAVRVPQVAPGDCGRTRRVMECIEADSTALAVVDSIGARQVASAGDSDGMVTVPDVTGMGARSAIDALTRAGLDVELKGTGHVTRQSIGAGKKVERGVKVRVEMK